MVTFTADLGQGEELEPARAKARMLGVREVFVEDLREEFVRDFVFPLFRANALYEGAYPARHLHRAPADRQAPDRDRGGHRRGRRRPWRDGQGQRPGPVRARLLRAQSRDPRKIAPWREWDLDSRARLIDFAEAHQIPVPRDGRGEAPFSVDANLLHVSAEGKVLEDPWEEPPAHVYTRTVDPRDAPDRPLEIEVAFERGDAVAIDGVALGPASLLARLNELGGPHGIGRVDLVENRFVGMKSRGVYETPGGTVLHHAPPGDGVADARSRRRPSQGRAHAALRRARLHGFWFAPERATCSRR